MLRLLQTLVTRQAEARPDATALVLGQERLTYSELEARSNRLARLLREAKCRRGDLVAFMIPKSPAAVVAMMGILKADCAYVPLDGDSPTARNARILRTCEPRLLLATGRAAASVRELRDQEGLGGLRVAWMDATEPERRTDESFAQALEAYPADPMTVCNRPEDTAHVLFTSGSTGAPKGVMITHANVLAFLDWATGYFDMDPDDRNSGHSPLHFDLSTFDVYGSLCTGGCLFMVPPSANLLPNKLTQFIRDNELTQWFSVPSALNYIARFDLVRPNDFPALERLIWCGEVFPTASLIYWMERLPHVQFTNLYGPTEATIASSYYTVPATPTDPRESIPIGTACEGEALAVLDEELRPVPVGEVGDLYISGAGLSPGYWRDPQRSDEVFRAVESPAAIDTAGLAPHEPSEPIMRLYKTGDLARVDQQGLMHFLGRADSQIKSRGYRIELGEIEAALNTVEEIRESAVVAIDTAGFEGKLICCAFSLREEMELATTELRTRLAELVPSYMLPSRWLFLVHLPLNANGKIDRPTLRERFAAERASTPWTATGTRG